MNSELPNILRWSAIDDDQRRQALRRPVQDFDADLSSDVANIINAVRDGDDDTLIALTRQFDDVDLGELSATDAEFASAAASLPTSVSNAIDLAIDNVRRFHTAQQTRDVSVETVPGVNCRRLSQPLESVGLYVPAGSAPLPSSAIMLAVPAQVVGCRLRFICTPPRRDGTADPAVLTVAKRCDIDTVLKIGGAQAIAAMAYGCGSVPKADKIFGPGNAWVTEAKAQVSTDPLGAAIDMPAGPSEVLVIADDSAAADFVAADLLSQAEHSELSQVVLIATSEKIAQDVWQQVNALSKRLDRRDVIAQALAHSRVIVVDGVDTAIDVSNAYAPEHLILNVADADVVVASVRNAGSVFVGPWAAEAIGDYCSGANHVLPTYGYARTSSGLDLDQFCRRMTVQQITATGLLAIADATMSLATYEGLDAHALAVETRLEAARLAVASA